MVKLRIIFRAGINWCLKSVDSYDNYFEKFVPYFALLGFFCLFFLLPYYLLSSIGISIGEVMSAIWAVLAFFCSFFITSLVAFYLQMHGWF